MPPPATMNDQISVFATNVNLVAYRRKQVILFLWE
ncbi:hypothetical protein SAMN05444050_2434 [Afipia sp. GAS231]|nr:hypothetical protein SAMN05444050_2434 [Afipia sp. GAS231]